MTSPDDRQWEDHSFSEANLLKKRRGFVARRAHKIPPFLGGLRINGPSRLLQSTLQGHALQSREQNQVIAWPCPVAFR